MRKLVLIGVAFLTFQLTGIAQSAKADLGKTEVSNLTEENWYSKRYKNYKPKERVVKEIERESGPYSFIVFGGTWCPDTRNLVPKFYKTIDEASISLKDVDLYLLDHYKSSPNRIEEKYNITSVPTFIIIKEGTEVGRIEGNVDSSIEEDLLEIIN